MASSTSDSQEHGRKEVVGGHTSEANHSGEASRGISPSPPPPAPHHPQQGAGAGSYPPAMGYPPPMGYPPAPGQHGYPPAPPYNYPAYGNNNGYHNYPYSQAPPAGYYNNYGYQQSPYVEYNPSGFARGLMLGLMTLVFLMFSFSILMWIMLRPQLPSFHIDSFTVSGFNASWPDFKANWEANLTVKNPNTKLKVYFHQINNFIYYEDKELLGASVSPPTYMPTESSYSTQLKLFANDTNPNVLVAKWVVEQLAEDKAQSGSVTISLRMEYWTTLSSSSWYVRKTLIRVFCEDIKVVFVPPASGNGHATAEYLGNCAVSA